MKRLVFVMLLLCFIPLRLAAAERCTKAKVIKVIDGDTVKAACGNKKFTVRLIGIDTPETRHPKKPVQCFGKESSRYLKERVEGRRVRLKYDVQKTGKYGRTLAYIYQGRTLINAEMVKKGYAFANRYYPNKYKKKFIKYEEKAKREGRGLWSACTIICGGPVCHTRGDHVPGR